MSLSIQALNFRGMREHVADTVRNAIIDGSLKPGDPLKDTELAALLHTSRGPVREALLVLEKEYLVRNIHNRGWFVIELTEGEVSEIISLRVVLEATALGQAALRITPARIMELERSYERLFDLAQRDDMVNLLKADFEFHQLIWSFSGHRLLQDDLTRISAPYFAYMQATIRSSPVPPKHFEITARQHKRLVEYLKRPAGQHVETLLQEHFQTLGIRDWDRLLRPHSRRESSPAQRLRR